MIPEEEEIIVHEVVNVEGVGEIPIDVEVKIEEAEEVFHHQKEAQQQHGSFFNTHFGQTSGSVIAVGNSYSTGDHGHAESRATAQHGPAHHHVV